MGIELTIEEAFKCILEREFVTHYALLYGNKWSFLLFQEHRHDFLTTVENVIVPGILDLFQKSLPSDVTMLDPVSKLWTFLGLAMKATESEKLEIRRLLHDNFANYKPYPDKPPVFTADQVDVIFVEILSNVLKAKTQGELMAMETACTGISSKLEKQKSISRPLDRTPSKGTPKGGTREAKDLRKENKQMSRTLRKTKTELSRVKKSTERISLLEREIERLKVAVACKDLECQDLRDRSKSHGVGSSVAKNLEQAVAERDERIAELTASLQETMLETTEHDGVMRDIRRRADREKEELEREVHALRQRVDAVLRGKSVGCQTDRKMYELLDALGQYKREANTYRNQVASLEGELRQSELRIETLQHEVRIKTESERSLRESQSKLQGAVVDRSRELEEAHGRVQDLQGVVNQVNGRLADSEKQAITLQYKLERSKTREENLERKEKTTQLRLRSIENKELDIDKRIVGNQKLQEELLELISTQRKQEREISAKTLELKDRERSVMNEEAEARRRLEQQNQELEGAKTAYKELHKSRMENEAAKVRLESECETQLRETKERLAKLQREEEESRARVAENSAVLEQIVKDEGTITSLSVENKAKERKVAELELRVRELEQQISEMEGKHKESTVQFRLTKSKFEKELVRTQSEIDIAKQAITLKTKRLNSEKLEVDEWEAELEAKSQQLIEKERLLTERATIIQEQNDDAKRRRIEKANQLDEELESRRQEAEAEIARLHSERERELATMQTLLEDEKDKTEKTIQRLRQEKSQEEELLIREQDATLEERRLNLEAEFEERRIQMETDIAEMQTDADAALARRASDQRRRMEELERLSQQQLEDKMHTKEEEMEERLAARMVAFEQQLSEKRADFESRLVARHEQKEDEVLVKRREALQTLIEEEHTVATKLDKGRRELELQKRAGERTSAKKRKEMERLEKDARHKLAQMEKQKLVSLQQLEADKVRLITQLLEDRKNELEKAYQKRLDEVKSMENGARRRFRLMVQKQAGEKKEVLNEDDDANAEDGSGPSADSRLLNEYVSILESDRETELKHHRSEVERLRRKLASMINQAQRDKARITMLEAHISAEDGDIIPRNDQSDIESILSDAGPVGEQVYVSKEERDNIDAALTVVDEEKEESGEIK